MDEPKSKFKKGPPVPSPGAQAASLLLKKSNQARISLQTVVLLAVTAFLSSCQKAPEPPAVTGPILVKTNMLKEINVNSTLSLIGVMDSRKSVDIFPRIEGYVQKILVSPGQSVTSGQLLVEMDRSKEAAAVSAKGSSAQLAEADLDKEKGNLAAMQSEHLAKESEVKFQKIEYDRYYWLEKKGVVSVASVDKEQRDLEMAQARLSSLDAQMAAQKNVIIRARRRIEEAEAELQAEKEQLQFYSLKAPFAGVVGNIPAKVGDFVNQQTKLTRISENKPLEVNIQIPKDEANLVSKGARLELHNDEGKTLATSTIFYLSPTVDLQSQSVLAKGLCENLQNEMRPDQTVQVKVILSSTPGITVPTEAISFVAGQAFVFGVEQKNGKMVAMQKPIKVTNIQNNRATVSDGLKSGDEIVVSGIQMLANGDQIQLDKGAGSVH